MAVCAVYDKRETICSISMLCRGGCHVCLCLKDMEILLRSRSCEEFIFVVSFL